jgi:hypothetical protein
MFDVVNPYLQNFIKDCSRHSTEAMTRHFIDVYTPNFDGFSIPDRTTPDDTKEKAPDIPGAVAGV